jgi:hypothetical protein
MALDRGPSLSSKSLLVCLNRQVFGFVVVAFNGDKVAARLDNALSDVEIAGAPPLQDAEPKTLCEITIFLDATQHNAPYWNLNALQIVPRYRYRKVEPYRGLPLIPSSLST